jgi:nucleoside-diphosphate-sugar epimerase
MDGHHAIVLGATGAVGSSLVRELLASPRLAALGRGRGAHRRPVDSFEGCEKLKLPIADLDHLERETAEAGRGCDAAFSAIGSGQVRTKLGAD